MGEFEQGLLRRAVILTVRWANEGLLWLLPEGQKRDLLEYRQQLAAKGSPETDPEVETLKASLGAWWGHIDLLQDLPQNLLAYVDPRHAGIAVYQKFGPWAVELLEEEFDQDAYRIALPSLRFIGILMLVFYAMLAVLDIWCLPETRPTAWVIRALVVLLMSGTTLMSFYAPIFKQYHQLITAITVLLAGIGIILIIAVSQPTELGHTTYYAGLHVLLMYVSLLSGLQFFPALLVSVLLVASYEVAELMLNSAIVTDRTTRLVFISNSSFLVNSVVIGAVSSNMRERSERINFMIRYSISHSFRGFLRYFEHENPATFLDNLGQIRYAPEKLKTFMQATYGSQGKLILPGVRTEELPAMPPPYNTPDFEEVSSPSALTQPDWLTRLTTHTSAWLSRFDPSVFWKRFYVVNGGHRQELEQAFEQDYFYGAITCVRLAIIQAILSYSAFAIDDYYCLPETGKLAAVIRVLMFAIAIFVWVASFREVFFKKYYQLIMGSVAVYAGCGINLMIAFSRPGEVAYATYYGGLIEVMYFFFFLCRVRSSYAVPMGLLLVMTYEGIAIGLQGLLESAAGIVLLVNNSLFLISAFVIGAIACNVIERNSWLDFLTMRTIAYKTSELLAYYESEKPTPRQLLDLISNIRHSPQMLEHFLIDFEKFKHSKA